MAGVNGQEGSHRRRSRRSAGGADGPQARVTRSKDNGSTPKTQSPSNGPGSHRANGSNRRDRSPSQLETPTKKRKLDTVRQVEVEKSARRRRNLRRLEAAGNSDTETKLDGQGNLTESSTEQSDSSDGENESRKPAGKKGSKRFTSNGAGLEEYFEKGGKKGAVSDAPVSKIPRISADEFVEITRRADFDSCAKAREGLLRSHHDQFDQWAFEFACGFNLIMYGHGSKRELLLDFVTEKFSHCPIFVFNGYFPSLDLKQVLLSICAQICPEEKSRNVQELYATITRTLEGHKFRQDYIILVVHNIDGIPFRNEKAQLYLSLLASHSKVRVIASVDHINAALMFDNASTANYNFLWHNATTFQPYVAELAFSSTLLANTSRAANNGSAGVLYVLASLTSNARGIYRTILETQLEAMADLSEAGADPIGNPSNGIEYVSLYEKCATAFLVSSDQGFKTQLTEFRDHEMIASKHDVNGAEVLYIPFAKSVLEEIMDNVVDL